MNRKTLFSLFFLCFAFLGVARADEVTIGSLDGAANNSFLPMNSLYKYSYSQQIYTADEIGMAGTINSITLWMYGNANLYEMPFDIYMVETDKDAFESKTDWETVTADDIVYSGTVTVHNTEAEAFTFDLDNSFVYSGQGNLLIVFNNTTGQWKSGLNGKVFGADSDPDRAIYARQDTGAYDPTDPTFTAYAISSQRNVIELAITPGSGVTCNKPETMEVSNLGANSATLTWTGGSGNYNVEYKLATETNWTPVLTNTTATTTALTSLTQATDYQARVQSVCSGDAISGWRSVNFTTECGTITSFPWTETFESYNAVNFADPCWVNEHIEGSGPYLFQVSTSTIGDNSTHKLKLPDMAEGTLTKLVLPEMNVPANYEFSIDIYRSDNTYNENYFFEGIRVYASTNGEIEGATELAFINRQFSVYDAIHNVIPPETEVGWYRYELPLGISGTCYIILQGESQNCTATYIDNLAVKPIPSCPRPTGFAVVSNSVTAHEATVSWTENGEATNWVLAYSYMEGEETMEQQLPITQNPYTITGLIPEMHYFNVCVRANCGEGDYSGWSQAKDFTTTIACPAPTNLVANPGNYSAALNWNGTSDSYIVSYRTAAYAEGIVEEFNVSGVPAGWTRYSGLVDDVIAGDATLTSVNSYWNTTSNALGQYNMRLNIYGTSINHWLVTPEFRVSQNLSFDLALTAYNSDNPIPDNTLQHDDRFVVLIYVNEAWTILREWNNTDSEYYYNGISSTGENVTIDLSAYYGQDVKIAFYGESTSSTGSDAGDNDLHIDNVICGIPYAPGEWQTITVDETTATIPGLTPLTAYEAKVQGDCDEDGTSLETDIITFTTLEGCPVPQNVEVENITHNSATVSWDGYNDSYKVSYRTAAYVDGVIEHFDVSGFPSGWTRYSGLVDNVIAGEATLTTISGYWNTNNYALGQYNMRLNIYGTSIKHWLVTPEFNLSQDLNFDLALTKYNSENPVNDTLQADDRFIVLIYADEAWHILREWNNSGSVNVFNAISNTGENVTIDLSAYYGKKVKIAFYGESTSNTGNNNGDNDIHIDNIVCGVPYEASEWQTIETDASPVVLSDLTPERDYEVKVQGFCGSNETEWSEIKTFTTLTPSFTKNIAGYSNHGGKGCYYLIASPIGTVKPRNVSQMLDNQFDLYYFDQTGGEDGLEWKNWKTEGTSHYQFNLESGKGYLYANSDDITLTFTGTPVNGPGFDVTLTKTDSDLGDWNLVGNPFGVEAYIDREFYTMNEAGTDIMTEPSTGAIAVMQGVFVQATAASQTLTFSTTSKASKKGGVALNLSRNSNIIDRAIVNLGEGRDLPKFQLFENSTKLYITKDNRDYAVVSSGNQGEVPVSFKAQENGTYTLILSSTFTSHLSPFTYLHLIDNLTGADIDLLTTPSYTFEASTTDYTSRFKLVFMVNENNQNNNDNFAFISNGQLIVNGEGTLQVIDMLGRQLFSKQVSTANCQLPTANFSSGVYVLQLINGENVKTQKIVVE